MSTILQCGLNFHHVGVMTARPDEACEFYLSAGYGLSWSGHDPLQKVRIILLRRTDHPMIELIHPLSDESPVSRLLENKGGGPYHTCYEVSDLDGTSRSLRRMKMLPTTRKIPAIAFGNRHIQFFYSVATGLIELLEAEKPVI